MIKEKNYTAISGFIMIAAAIACLVAILAFAKMQLPFAAIPFVLAFIFIVRGLFIVSPNDAKVLTLFGKYTGTVKQNGLLWVNPFFTRQHISLRARNLNGQPL